jgi:hypothetical protein
LLCRQSTSIALQNATTEPSHSCPHVGSCIPLNATATDACFSALTFCCSVFCVPLSSATRTCCLSGLVKPVHLVYLCRLSLLLSLPSSFTDFVQLRTFLHAGLFLCKGTGDICPRPAFVYRNRGWLCCRPAFV